MFSFVKKEKERERERATYEAAERKKEVHMRQLRERES